MEISVRPVSGKRFKGTVMYFFVMFQLPLKNLKLLALSEALRVFHFKHLRFDHRIIILVF